MPSKKRAASEAPDAAGSAASVPKRSHSVAAEATEEGLRTATTAANTSVNAKTTKSNGAKKGKAVETPPTPTRQSSRVKAKKGAATASEENAGGSSKGKGKAGTEDVAKGAAKGKGAAGKPPAKAAKANAKRKGKVSSEEVGSSKAAKTKKGQNTKDEKAAEDDEEGNEGQSYWLMKAEPDSRVEKGVDVKFSIDDLKEKAEPEAWDGVRNATARNNMRAMRKGDLAFFYHSNCKVPGIAGIMEIVREHSTDESAFDEKNPYYDAKSNRDNPKWCVVHVEFRKKLDHYVKLNELKKYSLRDGMLENMQVLKQSRLSVSKVNKKEWDFICGLANIDPVTLDGSDGEAMEED